MKKTRFSEEQMVTILREADKKPVPEVAKKHGVSAQTIYGWRKHFGTMEPADVKRLRPAGGGKWSAEKDGGRPGPRARGPQGDQPKKMVGARVRRQQVAYAQSRGLSCRRACALLTVARSTLGYQSRLVERDGPTLPAMHPLGRAVSAVRVPADSHLLEARRTPDEHRPDTSALAPGGPAGSSTQTTPARGRQPAPSAATAGANHVWAYDFVFDTCANGQTLKCLTVVDEWTREGLAIDVAGSIRSGRVIEVLTQLVSVHGTPRYLRSDNGPEFVARAILRWLTGGADRDRADRARQAVAECNRRSVQRPVARRVSEHGMVPQSRRGEGRHRAVAAALQRGPSAFESRLFDAARIQSDQWS